MDAATEHDLFVKQTGRSLILKCPVCGKDKLYFDKKQGNFICFAGSCGNKGLTVKLLSQIKGITLEEARKLVYNQNKAISSYTLNWEDTSTQQVIEEPAVEIPASIVPIDDNRALDGLNYLNSRGISLQLACKYAIMYNVIQERVVFVIKDLQGRVIGYQARAIRQVDKADRMRNNHGFRKGQFLMFYDLAHQYDHLIIAEGPVDAIKFDLCGGGVATMGKELTSQQLSLIDQCPAKKIYWALDEDADNLITKYASLINKESLLVRIPKSARKRVMDTGKEKVDFGECTPEECMEAFRASESVMGKILW